MIGIEKTAPDGAQPHNHTTTDGQGSSMTESAQGGRFSEHAPHGAHRQTDRRTGLNRPSGANSEKTLCPILAESQ